MYSAEIHAPSLKFPKINHIIFDLCAKKCYSMLAIQVQ